MSQPNNRHVEILQSILPDEIDSYYLNSRLTVNQALTALATLQGECDEDLARMTKLMERAAQINANQQATIASLKQDLMCDVCLGSGSPSTEICACRGTHSILTVLKTYREDYVRDQREIASLREEVERLKKVIVEKRWDDIDDLDLGTPYTGIIV